MEHANRIEHDAPYVNVLADKQRLILSIRWKNFAPSGTYRATLDLAARLMEEHHLRYFLTDQRRRGPILHEDEQWLITDWAPRLSRLGVQRSAVVQSADFFNRMVVDRIVSTVASTTGFPIRYFKTLEEAEEWLTSSEEVTV